MDAKVLEKFWANIEKLDNGCWQWTGPLDKTKLPVIRTIDDNGKFKESSPRRTSLIIHGVELTKSDRALPKCGNKLCVSPEHLVIGDEAHFWMHVDKSGGDDACWLWIGGKDKDDYGKFNTKHNKVTTYYRAHQYAYILVNGSIPDGMCICHMCDNPPCVNIKHLFLGSNKDNNNDCVSKNRNAKGETSGMHKLTEEQVKEIRELNLTNNYTYDQIAEKYNVSHSTINSIVNNQTWKHVK